MNNPTHEVVRSADGCVIHRGSYVSCQRYMQRTNGYFWLMIRPMY